MKVVAWGALPPPTHGSSVMNEISADVITQRGALRWLRPSRPTELSALGTWRLGSLAAAGMAFARLAGASLFSRSGQVCYISPAVAGPAALRDLMAWLVACLGRWRVVVHLHTGAVDPLMPGQLAKCFRWALRRTEAIVLLEQFAGPVVALGCSSVDVVQNGASCRAANHSSTHTPSNRLHAIFLSNMISAKGVDVVVTAFRQLFDEGDEDWDLTFAGEEPTKRSASLDGLILRASGRVSVVGSVDGNQRCALLREADVMLFPSRYPLEGSPLVLLEALEHGVQPIVSHWAGLVATAGSVARVAGDPQELVEVLHEYRARSTTERKRLAVQCMEQWRTGWTEQHYRQALADVLYSKSGESNFGVVGRA